MPIKSDPTPWDDQIGFWARVNRFFFKIVGPAQIGTREPEDFTPAPTNPPCPLCQQPMNDHVIVRGDASVPTRMHCPKVSA